MDEFTNYVWIGFIMEVQKETIWHFTCKKCLAWFSIATSDNFDPIKRDFFCPWCGDKNKTEKK
jgi:rRNA maturation endonuclease Nob1